MYGKIFESIYDGTLAIDWKAMIVFQQMIILADKDGTVDHTPASLSRRTGIPLDIIEYGVAKLEAPDPYSRTPDADGRRIVRIDDHRHWGWEIVNYDKYRNKASKEERREKARLRQQRKRERDRQVSESKEGNAPSRTVTDDHAQSPTVPDVTKVTPSDQIRSDQQNNNSPTGSPVPCQKIVDLYHEILPDLPSVKVLNEKRKRVIRSRWKTFKAEVNGKTMTFDNLEAWEKYFRYIAGRCSFMHGKNDRQWVANFDFVTRESGMVNTLEGKYTDRRT